MFISDRTLGRPDMKEDNVNAPDSYGRSAEAKLKKLTRVYAFLSEVNKLILRTRDRAELFDGACRIAVENGLLTMAWIGLVDEASGMVRPVACTGCEEGYLKDIRISTSAVPEGEGPTGTAVRTAVHSINNDTENNPVMIPWREEALRRGYRSSAAFPLMSEGKTTGAFTVYAAEPGFFDEEEVRLLDDLAANLSYALWSLEQEGLRRQADETARGLEERLRRLAEEALKASEGRYKSLFDNSIDGVLLTSPDGTIHEANQAACEMLGRTEEEIRRAGREGLVDASDPRLRQFLDERARTGKARGEFRVLRKDGTRFEAEVTSSLYHDKDGSTKSSLVFRDVTEKKDLERQKADLFAMVTHDLRSPLTAILGYADLLFMDGSVAQGETRETLEGIRKNCARLVGMVEDFLTFSRMEAGSAMLKPSLLDLNGLIDDTFEEFSALVKDKSIKVV